MYGSAVCKCILGLSRVRCCICVDVDALQYTMAHLWVLFSLVLTRTKKDIMQLYLIDITLYYNSISLLLQYHKLYINTHTYLYSSL